MKSTVYGLQSIFAKQIQALLTVKKAKAKLVLAVVGRRWTVDQKGFTIVEVLVVASILGVIGYMMSDIVVRSLQGSQKTAVIGASKQNGQVVLDSVTQVIRNSDQVVCVGTTALNPSGATPGDNIVLYSQDGRYVRFRLDTTSANPSIVEDFPVVDVLINNNPSDPNYPKSMQANLCYLAVYAETSRKILTDTDNNNGVLIQKTTGSAGVFTVTKRPGSNDAVTIQFDVKPSGTGGGFENQLGGPGVIQFQETVQLR